MASRLTQLPAVLKQRLRVEFTGFKQACPQGIFMSLTPGDPMLWTGVMFVKKGPYSPSILRFHVLFPPNYPSCPPIITFLTDIFHLLVTPYTTFIYTTSAQPQSTTSATDTERLLPGGFSLRHGFPEWFVCKGASQAGKNVDIYMVLRYMRGTFDTAEVLDKVPLAAAGHPGAWHAWRRYRVKEGVVYSSERNKNALGKGDGNDDISFSSTEVPDGFQRLPGSSLMLKASKRSGEWNWNGVWEDRVKKGIEGSLAEGVLFGKETSDSLIHFLNLDTDQYESIKEDLRKCLENTVLQRRGVTL